MNWPHRVIMSCNKSRGPLLLRYFIVKLRAFGVYVHYLAQSDDERALHDHPWSFITILLSSGYYEHTPRGRFWRRRFSVLYRPAEWSHRLELVKPCWTLILRGPVVRDWGFWLQSGWQHWRSYERHYCD